MDDKTLKALLVCFKKSPEEAVAYLKSQGIEITWDWREALDKIKAHCFTVAKVSSADILQVFKDEIDAAIADGETFFEFKKRISPILDQKGYAKNGDIKPWRLETIYRTNLQTAYMAGRHSQMEEVKESFPYWEFVAISDNRTTDGCRGLNSIVLRSDDAFWSVNFPPRHFKCRSEARAVSQFALDKRGLKLTNPKDVEGIMPAEGFDNIPGQWQPDITKYSPDIKKQLDKVLV